VVHSPQNEVSIWRRFVLPLLFVLALFVVLFLRRPDADPQSQNAPEASEQETLPTVVLRGQTMGTTYQIKLVLSEPNQSKQWEGFQAQIDTKLEHINDLMSTYRPQSDISKLNRKADTEPVQLQEDFAQVVAAALRIGTATQGAFDLTLGPIIELWGFDKGQGRTTPPTKQEIVALKAFTGLDKISLVENKLQKKDARVQINLSGIAKGYAVDAIGKLLHDARIKHFMVEIGGEILVQGQNAKGQPWRLGVNRPTPEAGRYEIIDTVELTSGGMATSGSYRNFFDKSGKRFHHIINPVTGAPVEHNLVSVTVLAPSCMEADGLATAAMVMGQAAFETTIQEKYPNVAALFVHQKEQRFEMYKTSNFPSGPL
jgi:FAD:protein FMN transferase